MLKRVLVGLFRSYEQTGEKAQDPALKTRYYRLSRDKVWEEVKNMLNHMRGYEVLHEMKNVGEIVARKKTATGRVQDITLTLFAINPVKTAVDLYSASRGTMGDLGGNYRTIIAIYQELDKRLSDRKLT